VLCSASCSIG